jgi:transposase-like protein
MRCPNCGGNNFRKVGGDFDGTYNVYKCHLCNFPWAEDAPDTDAGDMGLEQIIIQTKKDHTQ